MSKTHGLMFKTEMIQAYLAQRKTQTRRARGLDPVNQDPDAWRFEGILPVSNVAMFTNIERPLEHYSVRPPYGLVGDTLWFKETWKFIGTTLVYRADPPWNGTSSYERKWKSSMLMPHRYSRFRDVKILDVRVERLQSIDNHEAWKEGIPEFENWMERDGQARDEFARLWDSINGKTLPWSKNPWVFVYEFQRYKEQS